MKRGSPRATPAAAFALSVAACVALAVIAPRPAYAQARERLAAHDGLAAYQDGDYREALERFAVAVDGIWLLDGSEQAVVKKYIAYCHLALGRPDEAKPWIRAALSLDPAISPDPATSSPKLVSAFRLVRAELAAEAREASGDPKRSGMLRVISGVADASVTLDGHPLATTPIRKALEGIPAGDHGLMVTKPGYGDLLQTISIRPGETTRVRVDLVPLAGMTPLPTPLHKRRWVWAATAAAGIVATGLVSTVDSAKHF